MLKQLMVTTAITGLMIGAAVAEVRARYHDANRDQFADAEKYLAAAERDDPTEPGIVSVRATLALKQGKFAEADELITTLEASQSQVCEASGFRIDRQDNLANSAAYLRAAQRALQGNRSKAYDAFMSLRMRNRLATECDAAMAVLEMSDLR